VDNSDLQNSYPTFRRSSVRVKLGLYFFDSLESLQQFKSVVSFRDCESLFKSLVSFREFQSSEILGVVLECLNNGVFEMSWEFSRRMRSLESFSEVTRRLRSCDANDEKSRWVSLQYVYSEHTYTRVSESLIVPWSASEFLRFCAVVAKLTRSSGSNTFAAIIMCTILLAHISLKGLTFYRCNKRQLTWTVEYYNRVPLRSASLCILQSVSPPGLRCFQQQNHRRLLNIFFL